MSKKLNINHTSKDLDKISRFLSYVLRHKPESIGITLDSNGWVRIDVLIRQAKKHRMYLSQDLITEIVRTNDKKRFTLSEDNLKIRAAQGHSTNQVNIAYIEKIPPEHLYHGTATHFLDSIFQQGLIAGKRHYVHISYDEKTAVTVGKRHGKPIVLRINALAMYQQGFKFYLADNGVWLTNNVPSQFLEVI